MVRRAGILGAAVLLVSALFAAPHGGAQDQGFCLGDLSASGVQARPGPQLRFGITPAGEAGALGPAVPLIPEQADSTIAALRYLRAPRSPFVLRLNRFFWSGSGQGIVKRFRALTRRYTRRGFRVELQLRYHPRPEQEGDVDAWVRFVRKVTRLFGSDRRVVGLQIANEVNFFPFAPDASDSGYAGARDALIRGVIAAKRVAKRRGYHRLEIGFNWAYRTDPNRERDFWEYLRDQGGPEFVRAVDWVGLDAYPGTVFPPVEPPGGERDGMVNAMSQLRECFMPIAGLGPGVPIHVEENGWPTGPGRGEDAQADAMRAMVGAVHEFRGTYNVSDYRWFDLRDHNSSSPNFQQHYGLLRDDYSAKPAFAVFRELVRAYARRR